MFTFGLFAAVALLLASVGIYGTLAYATSRRTQEIGIRLALGARGEVVAMVIHQGMTVALIGTLVGLCSTLKRASPRVRRWNLRRSTSEGVYAPNRDFGHTVPMPRRIMTCVLMGIAASAVVVAGQSISAQATADKAWSVPRMPDGRPDFQGVWANNGMTPLERPKQFGLRAMMTDAELADLKTRAQKMMDGGDAFFADELFTAAIEGKTKFSSADTQVGNYDQTWLSERVWDNRTSLIIDPPDGRIPAPAPGAAERARAQAVARQGRGPADSPEDLSLGTRCISYGTPNIRAGYQSYFEITQGPGVLALRAEMIHDVRIFSTDKESHISPVIRQYHGDSRARWDGDTLVVDTTNYVANATRVGASDTLHTIEKFRRVAKDTLEYYVTFDDPTVWSRPWTLMIALKMTGERMFEYACHEGNYGLEAILRGAREQEKQSTR